ncbi:hypothetical protein D3C78_1085280 [compost metagenome]
MNDNHEAFEAYMVGDFALPPEQLLRDPETGEYDSIQVQYYWMVWRYASAESAARDEA